MLLLRHRIPSHAMPCHPLPYHAMPYIRDITSHHMTLHYIALHDITIQDIIIICFAAKLVESKAKWLSGVSCPVRIQWRKQAQRLYNFVNTAIAKASLYKCWALGHVLASVSCLIPQTFSAVTCTGILFSMICDVWCTCHLSIGPFWNHVCPPFEFLEFSFRSLHLMLPCPVLARQVLGIASHTTCIAGLSRT